MWHPQWYLIIPRSLSGTQGEPSSHTMDITAKTGLSDSICANLHGQMWCFRL
jgi:hypothetical protein